MNDNNIIPFTFFNYVVRTGNCRRLFIYNLSVGIKMTYVYATVSFSVLDCAASHINCAPIREHQRQRRTTCVRSIGDESYQASLWPMLHIAFIERAVLRLLRYELN